MTGTPALYPCTVTHVRTGPVRHTLRHGTYLWFIDIDRPPRLPLPLRPLARFEARDHLAGDRPTLRGRLEEYLRSHGIDLDGGPVTMLANARVLGHVFNPLTLYWCHDHDGTPRCVVAEVHNTYGERHCYLLFPDRDDVARTDKEFYVSPFYEVAGEYRMRLPAPGERLNLTVRLEGAGAPPFTATVRGHRRAATTRGVLRTALGHPLSTLAVSAAIRLHGIWLLLRGLPVVPRPRQQDPKGTKR